MRGSPWTGGQWNVPTLHFNQVDVNQLAKLCLQVYFSILLLFFHDQMMCLNDIALGNAQEIIQQNPL